MFEVGDGDRPILHSSWAASRPAFMFCVVVRESHVEVSDRHPGHAPSSSVVSACACCRVCRSPSLQLRNIRRSAGVRLRSDDRIELEERVKAEDGLVGQGCVACEAGSLHGERASAGEAER